MALVHQGGVELDGGAKSKRARPEFCQGEHMGPCRSPEHFVHRAYLCGPLARIVPQAKLKCDPSISFDRPQWPAVPKNPAPPLESCGVPGCGLPSWPTRTHLASSDVEPHGGVTNCPACTFNISNLGLGSLHGIPIGPPPPSDPGIPKPRGLLTTSGFFWDDFFFYEPGPLFGVSMSMPDVLVPMGTYGASLSWYFYDLGSWVPDAPSVLEVMR